MQEAAQFGRGKRTRKPISYSEAGLAAAAAVAAAAAAAELGEEWDEGELEREGGEGDKKKKVSRM